MRTTCAPLPSRRTCSAAGTTAVDYFQRAFHLFESAGDQATAARCCFHLGMILGMGGEPALAAGWGARAGRLVEELGGDVVEGGYVAFLRMHGHLGAGDWPAAAECADEATTVARRHHDADLLALGLVAQGRLAIYAGRVAEGLARLDESMAGAAAGEVSPIIFGNVYCTAIEGCQEIFDFGRVAEWTSALHRWCAAQPGLVAYTGQCSVHRGQVMRLRGAWTEALEEFALAIERYRQADSLPAIGLAEAERGDVLRLRGEYDAAEAAYQRAGEHGHDPQPGLALLWLARGSDDAAAAAVRRLRAEVGNPTQPCRLLPAAVDVLLAVGAVDEAGTAAAELDDLARKVGSVSLLALAAYASAAVELASGDPAGAMPYLRKARQLWARADSPYESARVRLLTGRALAALGDEESARQEVTAAREVFRVPRRGARCRGSGAAAAPCWPPGGPDRPRGRGAPPGRGRPQQHPGRGRAGAQREDRRPPPVEHLRQAGRRLPHRRRGVRVRAGPGVTNGATDPRANGPATRRWCGRGRRR